MANYRTTLLNGDPIAIFYLDAEELRGIAEALGHHDVGAQEMLQAAAALDELLAATDEVAR